MGKSRILCVHESGAVLNELQRALTNAGCDVLLAMDGEQAKRILVKEQIDGIVLSYDMPGADGRALRNQILHAHPDLPLLLFSDMDEIRDAPLRAFSDYLQHQGLPTLVMAD